MSDDGPASMGRRAFLGGAIGTAALTAASSTVTAEGTETPEAIRAGGALFQEDEDNGEGNDEDEDEEPAIEEIEVGDNGGNWFDPDHLEIEPGTTVRWVWTGNLMHNVNPTSVPDGVEWEGHPDLKDSGEYEFTFTELGTYEYTCSPHPAMDGTIVVTDDPGAEPAVGPAVPEEAMTLGIATSFALVATLGITYLFLKYGGESVSD